MQNVGGPTNQSENRLPSENNAETAQRPALWDTIRNKVWSEFSSFVTAISTFVLVIVTLCLAVYAKIQAGAALSANQQSLETARLQYRPYVIHEGWGQSIEGNAPATFRMKNFGQTPAINVVYGARASIIEPQNVQEYIRIFGLDEVELGSIEGRGTVVGAGSIHEGVLVHSSLNSEGTKFVEANFTDDDIKALNEGRKVLWLSGHVFYQDIFKTTHRTRFCFTKKPPSFWNEACPTSNEVD